MHVYLVPMALLTSKSWGGVSCYGCSTLVHMLQVPCAYNLISRYCTEWQRLQYNLYIHAHIHIHICINADACVYVYGDALTSIQIGLLNMFKLNTGVINA